MEGEARQAPAGVHPERRRDAHASEAMSITKRYFTSLFSIRS